jgi:hypothetical protein
MKKHFYLSLVLVLLAIRGFAQPQFSYTQSPAAYNTIPFNNSTNLRQWLYYPSNFPGMPIGQITKIYIKAQTTVSPSFALLTVRMGTTSLNNFTSGPYAGGLTTVYQGSYAATSLAGNWLEIQLQTPFYYDSLSNFIVECSQVGYSPGFNVMQTNSGVPGRSLAGYITSATATMQNVVAQIGFEIQSQTSPLGVKLMDFTASSQKGENILKWTVAEEEDMDKYVIERSSDGISFEEIGYVYADAQWTGENEYAFSDRSVPLSSGSGKLFYRLRMIGIDGEETLSSTVVLHALYQKDIFKLSAFPIPFSQKLTLSINVPTDEHCNIQVRDILGKTLLARTNLLHVGTHNLNLNDLDNINPGIYFITATVSGEQQTIRIIKN